jgi:hypothetical protein
MTIPLARKVEGQKFMWDGITYESEDKARQAAESYEKDGFVVQLLNEEEQYLVYSRRIAEKQTAD